MGSEEFGHLNVCRMIVGMLQMGPEDNDPSPLIAISYSSMDEARDAARLLLSLQNGVRPFSVGPAVYSGDTNIKVGIIRRGDNLLCEVWCRPRPHHLTCAFYCAGTIAPESFQTFSSLMERKNSYVLTVAYKGEPLLDTLNLIKYVVTLKGV